MNVKKLRVSELMSTKLVTIEPSATLRAAAQIFVKHHVHCLLVPSALPGACAGIVTIKDIVQVLCDGEPPLLDQLVVKDVMTTPSVSIQKDFSIEDAIRLMRASGVRSAPVLDGTALVGLLSFTDVVKAVAEPASE